MEQHLTPKDDIGNVASSAASCEHHPSPSDRVVKTSILGLLSLSLCVVSCEKREAVPTELASLVGAERDFARTCGEKGIRASFLQFFAEDGLSFEPEPIRVRDA